MDIRKIYEYALQREYEGKRFFEQNAERLSHAAAVGAFKNLAAEEQKHIEFIQSQIEALDKGQVAERGHGRCAGEGGLLSPSAPCPRRWIRR